MYDLFLPAIFLYDADNRRGESSHTVDVITATVNIATAIIATIATARATATIAPLHMQY